MGQENPVETGKLMRDLAAEAETRQRAGTYPEEWLREQLPEPMTTGDRELHDNLIIANQNADMVGAAAGSARGASPKAWLKRVMFRLLLFHLDHLNHYSTAVVRVLNRMNAELAEARLRDSGLREEMEKLLSVFGHRLADLEEANLAQRLETLEKAAHQRGLPE